MARWEPDSRGRLQQAALELYSERGFDQTTVVEIAARAGLTERTFFRHFADKREVLFAGSDELKDLLVNTLDAAPTSAAPIAAVASALEAVAALFQHRRDHSRRRQAVIAANVELQERELIKMAGLAVALADGLRRRGVDDSTASLTAEAGIAVFRVAFDQWTSQVDPPDLARLMREAFATLRAVTAVA